MTSLIQAAYSLHCRDQTRSYLKEQLESVEKPYQRFVKAVEESRQLAEEDRKGAELEKEKQQKQRSEMSKYRDNNKMVRIEMIKLRTNFGIGYLFITECTNYQHFTPAD